uniref:Uncharacterized protein n=1 Tax=Glossina palpalis gambiensis TaxID=67801 RepID=A0A1B0BAY6_9MUSC
MTAKICVEYFCTKYCLKPSISAMMRMFTAIVLGKKSQLLSLLSGTRKSRYINFIVSFMAFDRSLKT